MGFWSGFFKHRLKRDEELEAIHKAAEDFFRNDFPNPSRDECPPSEYFQKLVAEKKLPNEILRQHLVSCSECFNDYHAVLKRTRISDLPTNVGSEFYFNVKLVAGLAMLVIVLGSGFWFWSRDSKNGQKVSIGTQETDRNLNTVEQAKLSVDNRVQPVSKAEQQDRTNLNVKTGTVIDRVGNLRTTEKNRDKNRDSEEILLAKKETVIDLNESVWRGDSVGKEQKSADVESGKVKLRIKLPEENPGGEYRIFLANGFGKKIILPKTVKSINKNLSVELDLSKIKSVGNRLCFAPVGEIPDCILINIKPPK